MTKTIQSIGRVGDRKTAGKQINQRIYLLPESFVNRNVPFPVPTEDRTIGNVPLLSGKYWHHFDVVPYTQDDKSTSSKGEITSDVTNTISFVLGGARPEIFDFIEEYQGELFYLVITDNESGKKYLLGRELTPYQLQTFERSNGKDSRSCTVTFGNSSFDMPLEYIGTLAEEPVTPLAADATSIAFTGAREYKTSNANTTDAVISTFTGLTSADEDRVIVITGGGGTKPTTIANNSAFVLRGGTTWTGSEGAQICFKVLDADTLVEISRT